MPTSCTIEDLVTNSACLGKLSAKALLQIQVWLLCQIENGGTGLCSGQSGEDSPVGVATPDFVDQLYHQTVGDTYWRSTGLTDADWVEISGGGAAEGMVWGPDVTSLDAFNFVVGAFEDYFGDAVTTLNFPSLVTYTGNWEAFDLNGGVLETISFPALTSVGQFGVFTIHDCPALIAINIPVLAAVGIGTNDSRLNFSNNTALTSFSAPALVAASGNFLMSGCSLLSSVSLPLWVHANTNVPQINFSNCALDVTSVDLILHRCVLAGLTTAAINLSGGTNATPSAAGLADKATLIGNGCPVTTN